VSEPVIRVAALLLTAIFVASAMEKARWLANAAASFHPVLIGLTVPPRLATAVLSLGLALDVASIAVLLFTPSLGGWLAASLLICYTAIGWASGVFRRAAGCHCLGRLLDTHSPRTFLFRNAVLLSLALLLVLGN
jgi:hypothetical protein